MPYIITGTVTFSSQINRDAARVRVDTALASHIYTAVTTVFTPGVNNPTTTTITFSLNGGEDGESARVLGQSILDALVTGTRHTSGYLSINYIKAI